MNRWVPALPKDNRRLSCSNALPRPIQNYLSQAQMNCLRRLELFEWRLLFVRRENCNPPLVVLRHKDSGKLAVVDERGQVNFSPSLTVRAKAMPEPA